MSAVYLAKVQLVLVDEVGGEGETKGKHSVDRFQFLVFNILFLIYLVCFSFFYRIILVILTLNFFFKVRDFLKRHEVRI